MPRKPILSLFGQALLLPAIAAISLSASGQEVYQWKDDKGVTHYSETPPANTQYQQQKIRHDDVAAPAPKATEAASKTAASDARPGSTGSGENPQCAAARKNIKMLEDKSDVQRDTDGDGKPDKTLNTEERGNQLELARATLKANCPS